MARSESTWLGILTPIQGTYLPVGYSVVKFRERKKPFTYKEWERPKLNAQLHKVVWQFAQFLIGEEKFLHL